VGSDHLLVCVINCCHSWCLCDSHVSCCQVVILASFKLAHVTMTHSDMSDSCLLQSFSSNPTSIMLYLYHEMDVNYLVVDKVISIKNCFITIACLV
jgi:hypothetical protein